MKKSAIMVWSVFLMGWGTLGCSDDVTQQNNHLILAGDLQ